MIADGLHLEVHESDDADAPRVLLVHGSLDRIQSFQRVRRRLPEFTVMLLDRRGYGKSVALPAGVGTTRHAADVLAALQERPATVVGHSYGGLVAMEAAIQRPDLIKSVGAYEPPLPFLDWWPTRRRPGEPGGLPAEPALAAEQFFRSMVGDHAWERLPESFRAARRAEGQALLEDICGANDTEMDLRDVLVPLAIAHGGEGGASFARGAAEVADTVPDGTLSVIEGAGHGAHMSHPDAFAEFVRTAVRRCR